MSTPLNLFPARIRWCNPDGTLTVEALRMLQVLVQRVGGVIGDAGVDIFAVTATGGDQQQAIEEIVTAPTSTDAPASAEMIGAPASAAPPAGDPCVMQPSAPGAMFETTFQGSCE